MMESLVWVILADGTKVEEMFGGLKAIYEHDLAFAKSRYFILSNLTIEQISCRQSTHAHNKIFKNHFKVTNCNEN